MQHTCGVFILNDKNELLICHPTNASWRQWSVPKGLRDPEETHEDAAIRETLEETGLIVKDLIFLDTAQYTKQKKILYGYYYPVKVSDQTTLKCESIVEHLDIPEIDKFRWISLDKASNLIHETQSRILKKLVLTKKIMIE